MCVWTGVAEKLTDWKFIWWRRIYCWWLFNQSDPSTSISMIEIYRPQEELCWKINLIWSHFIKVIWSDYEIFSRSSCTYIYIYIYRERERERKRGTRGAWLQVSISVHNHFLSDNCTHHMKQSNEFLVLNNWYSVFFLYRLCCSMVE